MLPDVAGQPQVHPIETVDVECLVIGGGPAGLTAAIELGKAGVRALIVDDKHRLGGKLVLQTHKFFGSIEACHAGTRGIDIATRLEHEVRQFENVRVWLNSTVLAVFSDRRVGVLRDGHYFVVRPDMLLVATGAREKSLVFRGNTLPGVYGAGAFQTLVNRDLVRPTERLFIVGGGNVGLIAGYHALQAGIEVVGLCEACPSAAATRCTRTSSCGWACPIYTSHTILRANGDDEVRVGHHRADRQARGSRSRAPRSASRATRCSWRSASTRWTSSCTKAREFGLPAVAAGDAEEIAEASAAMFTGRIRGLEIARALGRDVGEVPPEWHRTADVLKSRPGHDGHRGRPGDRTGVFPVFHCSQEIPCNPCTSICPKHAHRDRGRRDHGAAGVRRRRVRRLREVRGHLPRASPSRSSTTARTGQIRPSSIPYEFSAKTIKEGDTVTVLDTEGGVLGNVEVTRVRAPKFADRALLVRVTAPADIAPRIAGIRVQEPWQAEPAPSATSGRSTTTRSSAGASG